MRPLWILLISLSLTTAAAAEPGNADRGARDFRACAACHSLQLERNMTGPSLANLFGRKAGSLTSFTVIRPR